MPAERHQYILRLALTERIVRIKDLAKRLGVHEMTIRRDLDLLAEQGLLQRVHGGARLMQQAGAEVAYAMRATQQVGAKARIARAARALISDGDTVGFDASTTALTLAQALGSAPIHAVVTGLDVANVLAAAKVPFTLVGGTFHERARSFVGSLVTGALARFHLDKVFFSAKGLTVSAGFTDAHLPEVEVKERLIATAGTVVALIDHTKLGREAFCQIVPLERIDVLITDEVPPEELRAALEAADIRLIVAEEAP
ncbi:transcriptional regulator, DeoR family [Truepera radiovictrix DSM 17093]|uniref:Transcriptional regulator, DeoR family n=1 Tax=Truepera radiovictrix (strain DSM 17093 / CIP 108686 / LMG 22925 / RQ-24) TaxID=649638 RepID=D7CWB2_TRURR|nr:transcriptional regulator, DeoR family [Truepera radiovictrix DSM 17093]